jgi:hypothetical protein
VNRVHAAGGKECRAVGQPHAAEEHREVSGRSGQSPSPGHGCSQELGRSMRACAREHADEKEECRSGAHGCAGPAGRKGGRITYRLWASSYGIAEAGRALVVFEGDRQAQRAGRCAGAAWRPPGMGGAIADQRVRGQRLRRGSVATDIQRHAHGEGAAREQRARRGTGMSALARACTPEGAGEGQHAEASGCG